jgi:hypothetical protein
LLQYFSLISKFICSFPHCFVRFFASVQSSNFCSLSSLFHLSSSKFLSPYSYAFHPDCPRLVKKPVLNIGTQQADHQNNCIQKSGLLQHQKDKVKVKK